MAFYFYDGTSNNDTYSGSVADDEINGLAGDDVLNGADGNDSIYGGVGNDIMNGGAGNDFIYVSVGNDTVNGGEGNDFIDASVGVDDIDGGTGYDMVLLNLSHETSAVIYNAVNAATSGGVTLINGTTIKNVEGLEGLTTGSGNDILTVGLATGRFVWSAGAGADLLIADFSSSTRSIYSVWSDGAYYRIDNFGNDPSETYGIESVSITGGTTGDNLGGTSGNDTLNGFAGNDYIYAGAPVGADSIDGGTGYDLITLDLSNEISGVSYDAVTAATSGGITLVDGTIVKNVEGLENLTTGSGNDTLSVTKATGQFTWHAGAGTDRLVADFSNDSSPVYGSSDGNNFGITDDALNFASGVYDIESVAITGGSSTDDLRGTNGNDSLNGGAGDDVLTGGDGNDVVDGGADNDTLTAGAGNDSLYGGTGDDLLTKGDTNDVIDGGSGTDTILLKLSALSSGVAYDGAAAATNAGYTLINGAVVRNTEIDILTTGSGNDTLTGGAGDDHINAGAGADIIDGGAGFDWLTRDMSSQTVGVIYDAVAAVTAVGYRLIDGTTVKNVEGLENLTTGSGDDTLTINRSTSQFTWHAGAGADRLVADFSSFTRLVYSHVSGSTLIVEDYWSGSFRSYAYDVESASITGGSAGDELDGTSGNDILNGGAGNDLLAGDTGNDSLDGGTGADMLAGNAGNDSLKGGSGDDTLSGGAGVDVIDGSTGFDLVDLDLSGEAGAISYNTGAAATSSGITIANGTVVRNVEGLSDLVTGLGDDTLTVTTATNQFSWHAGAGADRLVADFNSETSLVYSYLSGNAFIVEDYYLGSFTSYAYDIESVSITGGTAGDELGGTGGNDSLNGSAGADTMTGDAGNDTYLVDDAGDMIVENASEGSDVVNASVDFTLKADVETLNLTGASNLSGTGNAIANTIIGNSGNNLIDGGSGADTMVGGTGNDTFVVESTGDLVSENAAEGRDVVNASVDFMLGDNIESLVLLGFGNLNGTGNELDNSLTGTSGDNRLDGGTGDDSLTGGAGNDRINGGTGSDVIDGGTGDDVLHGNDPSFAAGDGGDTLSGGAGKDDLTGGAGNDELNGGSGADTMAGGAGADSYYVDDSNDVIIDSGEADIAYAAANFSLEGSSLASMVLTEGGNFNATGNGQNNTLTGNSGNNALDGGAGNDTLIGGVGDDTFVVDSAGDIVIENAGEGWDVVNSWVSHVLAAGVETLNLTGSADLSGTGNAGDNMITGNNGNNVLYGGLGNDSLSGGAGSDTLNGGGGNDSYAIEDAGDVVVEGASEGTDSVTAAFDVTLAANIENLVLTGVDAVNGTGNTLDNSLGGNDGANTLNGLAGNDVLNGGLGADTLLGGAGNDTYTVDNGGDIITEIGGQGTDVVNASISYTMGASIEVLNLTGVANIDGTGNSNNNILNGNDGNNALNGRAGTDTMNGGLGDDTYYVNDAGDKVLEGDGGGTDTVFAGLSYSGAGQYIENITLLGSGDFFALGNGVNNVLRGNSANNDLNGGGGADTMIGGTGSDTYSVDNVDDLVTETGSPGVDVVNSRVSFDIGAQYIEIVNLTFNGNANAYGSTTGRGETLNGNTANNILDGRRGADTLAGGLGNDSYYVDNAGDVVAENTAEGTDLVNSYLSYTLGANFENLSLLGAGNLTGTGNALGNFITGTTGNNSLLGLDGNDHLDGASGNDTLTGGLGNDTYVVDSATDSVVELSGEGTDTVMAFYSYTLGVTLENLTLTGVANINATGNGIANILTGNSGNNILDGGIGADNLIGGLGDDSYYIDDSGDVTTELNGQGTDTVFASVSYVLGASAYIDVLTLIGAGSINGTGNGAGNALNGSGDNNVLDGAGGNDILSGGAGNDTLIGGTGADTFMFALGSGQDVINDFKSGQNDLVNIHAYSNGVVDGGGVTLTAQGSNTLIDLGDGNTILVLNIIPTDNNFLSHIVW